MTSKTQKITFVDCSTLTASGNLPEFVQPGAKVIVTTEKGSAEVVVSALGQSPRQAYCKGFGKVLQETILKGASKASPLEGTLELAE